MKHYTYKSKDETEGWEDSDDFDDFDRWGYINPNHIIVMYKRGWISDKESAVAQYICCSIKMREYNSRRGKRNETYHESVEKIAAKFGLKPATVRAIVHRTKLFHREGGTGERRRAWQIGERPGGTKAEVRRFPGVKPEAESDIPDSEASGVELTPVRTTVRGRIYP